MDDLLQEFIAETREMLAAISGEIVAWEADPSDRARLDSIFRFVHTVKGSCGFLDLPRLERLSHSAEDALAEVRAGTRSPDGALVSAVLAIVDRIGELAEAIESGEALPEDEDRRLIAAVAQGTVPEAAPVPVAVQTTSATRGVARTIRLPIDLLDRMMGGVSDMVLARNELSRKLREAGYHGAVEAAFERLSASVAEMRDAITRTRMQRIDNIFSMLPRLVRDLSAELDKLVMLDIDGGDVELDREMIEMIRDPLTHALRNAIDHGIEPADQRRAAGKSAAGRIAVSARQAGNQILIEIVDDGRGIDADRVVAKAIAAGIVSRDRAEAMGWAQKLALIFEPGLSTAESVTAISGRGVGMDVVRANIEKIGGVVDVDSRPGQGLRMTFRVPLTLTIIPALTVSAAGQQFAIPRPAIEEIVRVAGESVRVEPLGGGHVASVRGERIPAIDLGGLLGRGGTAQFAILVVLRPAGGDRFALGVDTVHDHEELVVKPAAPAVMATGIYAGTTLPDNGRPMRLLDPGGIAAHAGIEGIGRRRETHADAAASAATPSVPTLLFRDLDGVERAIRLAVVERIEDVPVDTARFTAGRLRLAHDDRIIPLLARTDRFDGPRLRILRMNDGHGSIAYAIDEVIDIVEIGVADVSIAASGPIAGVVLIDGRQVELLDPFSLFAEAADGAPRAGSDQPLCLFASADNGWARQILAPMVEAAGYRVVFPDAGEAARADVVLAMNGDLADCTLPVVRLRERPEPAGESDPTIYRYDRDGLLRALRSSTLREHRR